MSSHASSLLSTRLGLIAVLCGFCVPLFIGLDRWDLENDEAIYSYAVDRMLETGDWLTPRTIPYDLPFLEKPPLKFWIVAAAIRAGLLPHDEFGLRFADAVFASVAFIYVFLLGRLLAGPLCGWVAVFVLFTLDPLLFNHGLRSNNMEAPLFLAFCGSMYHFARWFEGGPGRTASRHALAVAVYFTLGFMTKFVAALFIPVVCAIALVWHDDWRQRITASWRDWRMPLLVVLTATLPWFVYEAFRQGGALWGTMVERHVYERFTASLDPRHLRPWNFYYSQLWLELILAGSHWIAAIGAVMLAVKAWTGRPWLWRLLLIWLLVPTALISFGTSKVFHYIYPFLPPLALGAGAVAAALFRVVERRLAPAAGALPAPPFRLPDWAAHFLLAAALAALGIAGWTAIRGPIEWDVNRFDLFTNSSIVRPLVIGIVLLYVTGYLRPIHLRIAAGRTAALAAVAVILPVLAYPHIIERARSIQQPLHTLRGCVMSLGGVSRATHVFVPYDDLQHHAYYYYLRGLGPWVAHQRPGGDDVRKPLSDTPRPLLLVSRRQYSDLMREEGELAAVALGDREPAVIVTSGALEVCAPQAITSGGVPVGAQYRVRQ